MDKKEFVIRGSKVSLSIIPIIGSLYSEVIGYMESERIEKRLVKLEQVCFMHKLPLDEIIERISSFNEHEYYVLRNNLKYLLTSATPEGAEVLNQAVVSYIKYDSSRHFTEIISEIISNLNCDDLLLLSKLKNLIESGFDQKSKNAKLDSLKTDNQAGRWKDRVVIFGEYTIFYNDFIEYCGYFKNGDHYSLDILINSKIIDSAGNKSTDLATEARAFLKLQSIGVLTLDIVSTVGSLSLINIDKIHITEFGKELFKYLE